MPIRLGRRAILTFRFLALPSPTAPILLETKLVSDGSGSVAAAAAVAVEQYVEFYKQR
jgi:hypothetical protein